jgi:hypothetical protein
VFCASSFVWDLVDKLWHLLTLPLSWLIKRISFRFVCLSVGSTTAQLDNSPYLLDDVLISSGLLTVRVRISLVCYRVLFLVAAFLAPWDRSAGISYRRDRMAASGQDGGDALR